jgi:outer membrane protein OmpA-like peptidoglycan-associated protein
MYDCKVKRVFKIISKVFFLLIMFHFSNGWCQSLTSKSKRAIALYNDGQQQMEAMQFEKAADYLNQAVQVDTSFIEAYILLGEANIELEKDSIGMRYLKKALAINPEFRPMVWYELASTALRIGKYTDAQFAAEQYLAREKTPGKIQQSAVLIKSKCVFAIDALQHPVPFNPIRLSDNINSEYNDYWPSLSADEQTFVFTRQIPINSAKPFSVTNRQEDFYISKRTDSLWEKAYNMGSPINTVANEGAQSISIDGRKMYFTACGWPGGYGHCDIWFSMIVNDKWIPPVNVGKPVNSAFKERQPSISPDGKNLYFVSDRPGGLGGFDIWMCTLDESGNWGEAKNLGPNVNTPFHEQSPFIHFDNQTLYFSSDGWPGMGDMDVYKTHKVNDTAWEKCTNLGYPINTYKDEIGFIVNAKGNLAYFASDRKGSKGIDLYSFELYKDAQPTMVTYMKGRVYESVTNNPVSAKFELIDLEKSEIISRSRANQNGEFLICLPTDRDYAINVSAKNYLFYSDHISLTGVHEKAKPFLVNIALQPIKTGTHIVLKNIFYEVGSFELKSTSETELTKLVEFMNNNPTVKIEISGHTDNTGTAEYNKQLSENRAKSVVDYLIRHAVTADRLTYKGYGATQPVTDNNTEEGRAQNRRTEIKIIE